MIAHCVWEHNGADTLLYAIEYPGAFARGSSLDEALSKMPQEIACYLRWIGEDVPAQVKCVVSEEKESQLMIRDADSDVIFETERKPLDRAEYEQLKSIVLRSADDFQKLYDSLPDRHQSCLAARRSFYGQIPRTAQEMYIHTRDVNSYYFGEIGVAADHDGGIAECRRRGFLLLEQQKGFLDNPVLEGSYQELWSLRKMLRRFLWHDRIHAKAMWRMAKCTFPGQVTANPFMFE